MMISVVLVRYRNYVLLTIVNIIFIYGCHQFYDWHFHPKLLRQSTLQTYKDYFLAKDLTNVSKKTVSESYSLTTQLPHSNFQREPGYFKKCKPQQDIVFLKVHKAGSTSVLNMLLRYGLYHKLVFALPKNQNYFNRQSNFDIRIIMPPPKGKHYNILCNHSVYNRSVFQSLFPSGTFYLAIVRQPFEQFISAFNYYNTAKAVMRYKKNSSNPIREYLKAPNKIRIPGAYNFVNNRMAYDFGIVPKNFTNKKAIENYLTILDKDFDFVMIVEYFEESLILLRRYLCWTMKDIVSIKLNSYKRPKFTTFIEDYERHSNITMADYIIYGHFLEVFWKRVAQEGPSFFKELNHFKQVQKFIETFCKGQSKRKHIVIPSSDWNMAFEISQEDCKYITIEEIPFVNKIRKLQYAI